MIIRSFVAETMAAALKEVRTQMGGNAVVLKSRKVVSSHGDNQFEVTACLDNPTAAEATRTLPDQSRNRLTQAMAGKTNRIVGKTPVNRMAPAQPPVMQEPVMPEPVEPVEAHEAVPEVRFEDKAEMNRLYDRLAGIQDQLQRMLTASDLTSMGVNDELQAISAAAHAMRQADVPEFYIRDFFTSLRAALTGVALTSKIVRSALHDRLTMALGGGIELKPGDRVLVFGPAGAGKTSVIGKLAWSLVSEKKIPVRLASLDSIKVGALDEIQSLGDILGVEVADPSVMNDPARAGRNAEDANRVVLIDSGALPTTSEKVEPFRQAVEFVGATHKLAVYSGLTRAKDIERQANLIAELRPTHTVLTGLDLTDCWGAVFAATDLTATKLALINAAPSGTGTLKAPSLEAFMINLLGDETKNEVGHD